MYWVSPRQCTLTNPVSQGTLYPQLTVETQYIDGVSPQYIDGVSPQYNEGVRPRQNGVCSLCLPRLYVDPCEMLNNFCFHVYAQKSLFIDENCYAFLYHHHQQQQHPVLQACEFRLRVHRAGSQLKIKIGYDQPYFRLNFQ